MTPFYRINPRWTGIFQSRGGGCELVPEEGFGGLIGPSWVFQLGSSRQGLGGEWWMNGGARCHSVGDRGIEPHLILVQCLLASQEAPLSVWSVSAIIQAFLYSVVLVGNCRWFQVSSWFGNLNNLREASRRHQQQLSL